MKSWQSLILAGLVFCGTLAVPAEAEAGPLLDWLRGKKRCRTCAPASAACNTCPTAPGLAQANPWNLQPGQCATTCNQTCSRTVVNYVPYTAYRCSWEQVPVTQYKPVTSSDPCTGCSVTCMKPCTSYTWQMKQVPYTTYRAVYRSENYTVPVTTISSSGECNTCGVPGAPVASGCATCNVPGSAGVPAAGSVVLPPVNGSPVYGAPQPTGTYPYPGEGNVLQPGASMTAPDGTLGTSGGFSTSGVPTPADTVPVLNVNPQSMQRPILDSLRGANDSGQVNPQRNAVLPGGVTLEQTTIDRSALRRDWGYSPIRLASHQEPGVRDSTVWTFSARGEQAEGGTQAAPAVSEQRVNSSWRNAGW